MDNFCFGWWSSGRDEAAVELFDIALRAIEEGHIPGKISYLFLSKEEGESEFADEMSLMAEKRSIPVFRLSAGGFEPDMRRRNREGWRDIYHHRVLELISSVPANLVVLAGYMWVVSPEACDRLDIINLHPAAPGGPAGTWQEVIWQLLETGSSATGVMMHLVTPALDQGPPVTYCTFNIEGGEFEPLWLQFKRHLKEMGMDGIKEKWGENYPLFSKIRAEGVRRELPLIVETMRAFASGDVAIMGKRLVDRKGQHLSAPYDLTQAIESYLATHGRR